MLLFLRRPMLLILCRPASRKERWEGVRMQSRRRSGECRGRRRQKRRESASWEASCHFSTAAEARRRAQDPAARGPRAPPPGLSAEPREDDTTSWPVTRTKKSTSRRRSLPVCAPSWICPPPSESTGAEEFCADYGFVVGHPLSRATRAPAGHEGGHQVRPRLLRVAPLSPRSMLKGER